MNKPKISIIIPIYNTELYLRDALQSVISQTLEEIEIICVNDGSSDNSVEIVREYKDPRIRLIHHKKNQGLLMARKTGVKEARGEYCIFLDSDDELVPECCETIYNLIRQYRTDILCFSFQVIEDRNTSNKLDSYFRSVIMPDPSGKTRHVMRYMLSGIWYGTTIFNKIYRTALLKTAYRAMDSFSCVMGEDVYSSFYIAYYARSLKSVETGPLYIYHYGSGVSTKNVISLQEFQDACNMGNLSRRIKRFLIKEEAWRHCKRYWKAITKRLWEDSCKSYILRVAEGYENDSITMLLDSWGGIMTERDLCIRLIKELRKSKEQERRAKDLNDWYMERNVEERVSLADATLKSFEEGGIGMKYILKYAKAWAGYKLRR